MIVWVDDALFGSPGRDMDRLALLRNAARRRHTVIISTSPAADRGLREAPRFASWAAALPDRLRLELKIVMDRIDLVSVTAVTRGARRVLVCDRDPGAEHRGCRLSLDDAVRTLALPLHMLVEHKIHDAAFLRRILPPAWRTRFAQWERRGELHYENGGGLSVIAELVRFHSDDDNARLAFGAPADIWQLLHFFLCDHDGDSPTIPGPHSAALERTCEDAGLTGRWHRLERRDQEHYLPVEVLRAIIEKKITDRTNREALLEQIDQHEALEDRRHFSPLPSLGNRDLFKNAFMAEAEWPDEWFEKDGAWPEMTRLAEQIASAM